MPANKNFSVKVDYFERDEGEGALSVSVKNGKVMGVEFKIFEPPRFFEAFLRGRKFYEAPDITARICGICPVAYQMSAVHAVEAALGVKVGGRLRELRRLLYCGEWIESHVLHIFLLHAPDFLGYEDAIAMAAKHGDVVKRALRMKKAGNAIVNLLGGREIHPVNVKVGGFYRVFSKAELQTLVEELKWGRDAALKSLKLLAKFDFPDIERKYNFVCLSHPQEYPFNEGNIISSSGVNVGAADYEKRFTEIHERRSTALHSRLDGDKVYFTGPLARFNLCYEKLSPLARQAAASVNFKPPCGNPFKSILARGVETVYAFDEALKIIKDYEPSSEPSVKVEPKAGRGCAATEAPRGTLYHRYELDEKGFITSAKIVPPTAQNQRVMEQDLRAVASANLSLSKEKLTLKCEQAVRNYDPCISCSTHFIKLKIKGK